ncbi:NADH dehydrogenase subunit 6 (mitochondrion) [Paulinella micropora]|uniref:NADH-ubiquinone oxidoreductase chain 6 n=1 Tax=Paulinella micropora TaxID=1928728 RepID=A0A5K7W203_9EUKA|nr:NADH dehydrogenase subunit 6 [Paulinella micropora]BBL86689.1 NADH dehydrogenase subunit 6 [Paulinella micropora]
MMFFFLFRNFEDFLCLEVIFFIFDSFFSNYFIFFASLCCYFSFKCVFSKNIIEVLYSLVCVFLTSSGCLFCINVEFLAIINITVYVGAIIVLFLFSTMLLDFREITLVNDTHTPVSFAFFLIFFFSIFFELYENSINCLGSLGYHKPSLFKQNFTSVDFLYVLDFCVQDIRIFQALYFDFGFLLLVAALILLIVMLSAVSLCLSSKSVKSRKKFLKVYKF